MIARNGTNNPQHSIQCVVGATRCCAGKAMLTIQAVIAFWDRQVPPFLGCLLHSVDQKRLGTSV